MGKYLLLNMTVEGEVPWREVDIRSPRYLEEGEIQQCYRQSVRETPWLYRQTYSTLFINRHSPETWLQCVRSHRSLQPCFSIKRHTEKWTSELSDTWRVERHNGVTDRHCTSGDIAPKTCLSTAMALGVLRRIVIIAYSRFSGLQEPQRDMTLPVRKRAGGRGSKE